MNLLEKLSPYMYDKVAVEEISSRHFGMTPRGEAMPQTIEEWKHLVDLDEVAMRKMVKEIGDLKSKVASLSQKVASQQIKLDRGDL